MPNLNSYPWISATARMGITDIMWEYNIQIDGDASDIKEYSMLEYRNSKYWPMIRCVPVSKTLEYDGQRITTNITGYSRGIYLRNPIHIMERQSKITLKSNGSIDSYENPGTYLTRVWNLNNPGMVLSFQVIDAANVLKKQYIYDAHPINDLLTEIAEDYNRVYFEKITLSTEEKYKDKKDYDKPAAHTFHVIDFSKIDTLLGLPVAPLVILPSDNCLIGNPGLKIDRDLTESFNTVWVELCRKKDNAWFVASATTGELPQRTMIYRSTSLLKDPAGSEWRNAAGTVVAKPATANCGVITPIEGYENTQSIGISMGTTEENEACQLKANNKAKALVEYLKLDVKRYEATLRLTKSAYYKLALYQKIQFHGFTTIPEVIMRITDIEFQFNPPGSGGDTVRITLVPETELALARKFEQMQDNIRANQMALKQSIERGFINNKMGIVKSLSPGNTYANLQLRSTGRNVQIRAWGERIV